VTEPHEWNCPAKDQDHDECPEPYEGGGMKERKWNPYAEEYDIVLDTIEEFDQAEEAARALAALIGATPGWLVEEVGLDKALDLLNNVTLRVPE
jgi:hypothetical protein